MKLLSRVKGPLLLGALVLVLFWDLLWLPADQAITGNDLVNMFLQWWPFGTASLRQGELPLWNPYLFSGVPFFANPQPALFYPPVWLLLLWPASRVATALVCLHLGLAGVGMYGWLRAEEADPGGAFWGAVIYAFSGYFFARLYAGHLGIVMTQAWLPLILWVFYKALRGGRLAGAVLGGLPVALSLLTGNVASFLYVGLALAAYALYHALVAWRLARTARAAYRPLLFAGLMALSGLGLAAIQIVPTWEFSSLSTRQAADYAFAADHSWPPGYLLTLLVPNFFGEPLRTGYWGAGVYHELIFYSGVLPLFLTLALGGRFWRRPRALFLLALGGAGLALALGQFGMFHRLAYNFIPPFQVTRAPARAGFLFTFAVAALAGLALTWLRREPEAARARLRAWVRGPWPRLVLALAALVVLAGFMAFALQRESHPQAGRLWHVANNTALFVFFFLLSLGLLWAWGRGWLQGGGGTALAVGLALLDLWGFGRALIQPLPLQESAYWRIVADVVRSSGGGVEGDAGRVLPWGLSAFEHNRGLAWGLESVFGYDPLELERYFRFTTALPDPQARAYDLLHARYLVTAQEMSFPAGAGAPRLIAQQGGVWVYERPTALPAAWLAHRVEVHPSAVLLERLNEAAFDPAQVVLLEEAVDCQVAEPARPETVQFARRGNNRVEVQVQADAGGVLVLSEIFYPGWRATLDGEPVPVVRADYVLRGVCVPPGSHQVTFTFAPTSLKLGAGITLFCLLGVGWAGYRTWRRRAGEGSGQPDLAQDDVIA